MQKNVRIGSRTRLVDYVIAVKVRAVSDVSYPLCQTCSRDLFLSIEQTRMCLHHVCVVSLHHYYHQINGRFVYSKRSSVPKIPRALLRRVHIVKSISRRKLFYRTRQTFREFLLHFDPKSYWNVVVGHRSSPWWRRYNAKVAAKALLKFFS